MSADLLTAEERRVADRLEEQYDGVGKFVLSAQMVDRLVEALSRIAPKPPEKTLAQVLYEAEGLYEKPWDEMSAGERSQYVRMEAAAKRVLL